jgi:DNA-binding HxlR family transcriptional regulator
MQRKSFGKMACPIARSLERVGEWWSILIIRDALHGFTRFDQFQKSLNIAPNMLARRLSALVDGVFWSAAATANGRRATNIF